MASANNSVLTSRQPSWRADFVLRAQVRMLLVQRGALTAAIWTFAVIGCAWLKYYGAGAVVPWIFVLWFVAALPMMYLDLTLILDLVGYVVTGKVHFFPSLLAVWSAETAAERMSAASLLTTGAHRTASSFSKEEIATYQAIQSSSLARNTLRFLDSTSPLGCFALWSMIVLSRIPSSAHVLERASEARAMKLRADRQVYAATKSRLVA